MIYYFTNIDDNLNGKFTESDQLNNLLDTIDVDFDRGMRTGATIVDLFSGDKLEMIVGNYSGGLEYFNGKVDVLSDISDYTKKETVKIYPNPASNEISMNFPEKSGVVIITLYNIDGVEIMSKTLNVQNNFASFSISEIENGVYLLKSKIRQKIYKDKLIVVK